MSSMLSWIGTIFNQKPTLNPYANGYNGTSTQGTNTSRPGAGVGGNSNRPGAANNTGIVTATPVNKQPEEASPPATHTTTTIYMPAPPSPASAPQPATPANTDDTQAVLIAAGVLAAIVGAYFLLVKK